MYNVFFKILILITVLSTLCILGLKPKMHSKVLIYNSEYTIVEPEEETAENTQIPEKEQVQVVQNTVSNEVKKEIQKKDNFSQKTEKLKTAAKPKQEAITASQKVTVKQPQKEVQNTVSKPTVTQTVKQPQKVVEQAPKTETSTKKTENTAPAKVVVQPAVQTKTQTQKAPETKVLTQQEEEIAWNIWRSNLQNQIMRDTKLPYIPKGTVFKFSFDVDKYGRITNIKTWSLTPNYTPYAIQYIAPVIRSYQGKDILDFPRGTQRTTTNFTGGWKISDSAKYSTPNDYNDIEKVIR